MTYLILVAALAIGLGSGAYLVKPEYLRELLKSERNMTAIHISSATLRLIVGIVLIAGASQTRHPLIIQLVGWMALISALILVGIGRRRFSRLITWSLALPDPGRVLLALAGIALGAFLIYANLFSI